jgi:transposase
MQVLYRTCAGLDVHKRTVVVCRLSVGTTGEGQREVRTFGTMTAELLELVDWLQAGLRAARARGRVGGRKRAMTKE